MSGKTVKQLIAEMEHRQVTLEEFEQAREYQRSLIPKGAVLPKDGECYQTSKAVPAIAMVVFAAAFTNGHDVIVPAGTRVKVLPEGEPKPIVIACMPLEHSKMEKQFVSKAERTSEKYSDYYLSIDTLVFLEHFERIAND